MSVICSNNDDKNDKDDKDDKDEAISIFFQSSIPTTSLRPLYESQVPKELNINAYVTAKTIEPGVWAHGYWHGVKIFIFKYLKIIGHIQQPEQWNIEFLCYVR